VAFAPLTHCICSVCSNCLSLVESIFKSKYSLLLLWLPVVSFRCGDLQDSKTSCAFGYIRCPHSNAVAAAAAIMLYISRTTLSFAAAFIRH